MVKGVLDFYNDTADMWANDWYKNESMLPFLKEIKNTLPNFARVLDVGCNSGYETMRMKKLGLNPVGLDFSEKSIILGKHYNPDIEFVCDNMLNDLSYLGKFDAIVAIASVIHIPVEKLDLFFNRMYDILDDNGYIFLVIRSEEGKSNSSYKTVNGVEYDREVYVHSKEILDKKMNGLFCFEREYLYADEAWKYYCYKKI